MATVVDLHVRAIVDRVHPGSGSRHSRVIMR